MSIRWNDKNKIIWAKNKNGNKVSTLIALHKYTFLFEAASWSNLDIEPRFRLCKKAKRTYVCWIMSTQTGPTTYDSYTRLLGRTV